MNRCRTAFCLVATALWAWPHVVHAADAPWLPPPPLVGSITLQGDLALGYPLGDLSNTFELELPVRLEHAAVRQFGGATVSRWLVQQLSSFLVPSPDGLLWKGLGRETRVFRDNGECAFSPTGDERQWTVRPEFGGMRVEHSGGDHYFYQGGGLKRFAVRNQIFEVQSEGGRVTLIRRIKRVIERETVLTARYTGARLTLLEIGPRIHHFKYNESGALTDWTAQGAGSNSAVSFHYANGLIAEIRGPNGSRAFRWSSIDDKLDWRVSNYWTTAALRDDGEYRYTYDIDRRGIVITAAKTSDPRPITVVLNPLWKRLTTTDASGQTRTEQFGPPPHDSN